MTPFRPTASRARRSALSNLTINASPTGGAGNGDLYPDAEARERAVRYSRLRRRLLLVDLLWMAFTSMLALTTGWSARLRDRATRAAPARLGAEMPYALAATLASSAASLPLSYFSGYVIEHRYGLSNQTRRSWLADHFKGLGVSLVFELPLVQGVYWIMRRFPRTWWAVLSGLALPFTVLLAQLAPVLIMPLFNKYEPLKNCALADRITSLAAQQNVHVSDVLQMDMSKQTKTANAFFTGMGRTKRIVLGDTMLNEFTDDELEVVLAHELGHQVHRDLWKGIAFGTLTTFLMSYSLFRIARPVISRVGPRFGLDVDKGVTDPAALPLIGLLLGGISLVLLPIQNAFTRTRIEHPADRYALDLTGNKEAFVGAMEKLARMNLADPEPSALVKFLLYSHPPVQERIAFGRSYEPNKK